MGSLLSHAPLPCAVLPAVHKPLAPGHRHGLETMVSRRYEDNLTIPGPLMESLRSQRASNYIDETAPWALAGMIRPSGETCSTTVRHCDGSLLLVNAYLPASTAPKMMDAAGLSTLPTSTQARLPTACGRPPPS